MTDENDIITADETAAETFAAAGNGEKSYPPGLSPDVPVDSRELAEKIVRILSGRKATDIALLKIDEQTVLTDYFVICTGNSNTQIKGIEGEVDLNICFDPAAL